MIAGQLERHMNKKQTGTWPAPDLDWGCTDILSNGRTTYRVSVIALKSVHSFNFPYNANPARFSCGLDIGSLESGKKPRYKVRPLFRQ